MRTLITNASQIVTFLGNKQKKGKEMSELHIIEHGCVLMENDVIIYVGTMDACPLIDDDVTVIDAQQGLVMPGLIDSHTHLVFGQDRAQEFYLRLNQLSYEEILKKGGGIHQSIENTSNTPFNELVEQSEHFVKRMIEQGVTTIEAKSGYSRDFDGEVKQMEVVKKLNETFDDMLVSTCLAAHVIPLQYKDNPQDYISMITDKLIPYVKQNHLATFFDAFLENNAYDAQQVTTILNAAKEAGFKTKMHCDEINDLNGAKLAASLGCTSAEHLLVSNRQGLQAMAASEVIANVLPLTAFSLKKSYANARMMIDEGLAVSLATDFNPGSCFTYSMPMLMALSVMQMNLSIEEMICGVTINAAAALSMADQIGTLEEGKQADVVIFQCPSYVHLVYHTGINQVKQVIKKGRTIYKRESQS